MSQMQTQGPKVFLEPSKTPFLYTENQTIFPEPRVAVGEGIDIGAIAKGISTLGTTIVDTTMDYRFNKIGEALDNLTYATDAQLKLHADNADFNAYKVEQDKYKQQVNRLLGFNPEDKLENTGFLGKREFNLRAQANKALSSFDNNLAVSQKEYDNMVEIDTFTAASHRYEKELQGYQTPEERIQHVTGVVRPSLEKMFKARFSVDMFNLGEDSTLPKPQRALARAMEAEWLKLENYIDSAKREIDQRKPEDALKMDENFSRNNLRQGSSRLDSALKKVDILGDAIKNNTPLSQLTPDQQAAVNSAAKDTLEAREYYRTAVTTLLQQAKVIEDQFLVGPPESFEDSAFNIDPFSKDALDVLQKYIKAEAMGDFITFQQNLQKFDFAAMNTTVSLQKSLRDNAVDRRKAVAKATADKAVARLERIKTSNNPEAENIERSRLAGEVETQLTQLLLESAPGYMSDYLSPFNSTPLGARPLPATYDISLFGSMIGARQDTPPRYSEEWQTYHNYNMNFQKQVFGDIAQGQNESRSSTDRKRKEQEENRRLLEIVSAETEGRKPIVTGEVTNSDRKKAAFLAISMRLGSSLYDDDGNLKNLETVVQELSGKGTQIPLPFSLLQETPYWDDLIYSVQNSKNPQEELARLFAPFLSGPAEAGGITWDDIKRSRKYTTAPPAIDNEQKRSISQGLYSEDPTRRGATEALFLMYPKETRDEVLLDLETEAAKGTPEQRNTAEIRLSRLTYLNDEYRDENPFNFVGAITVPEEQLVTYNRLRQTLIDLKGKSISKAQLEGIDKTTKGGGIAKVESSLIADLAAFLPVFNSTYPLLEVGNGMELTTDQTSPVNDQLRSLLIDPKTSANRVTAASIIDPIILEAYFETKWEHPTLDPTQGDFKDILISRVNARLKTKAWNGTNFVEGYDKTKTTGTFEKTTMPSHVGTRARVTGVMSQEEAILNSSAIPEDLTDPGTVRTVASQFFSPTKNLKTMLDAAENKHAMIAAAAGGSRLPAYIAGLSKDGSARLSYRLSLAALNGNTDTAGMLAAQATLALLGEAKSEDEAVTQAKNLGRQLRDQLLDGTLKLETESRPSLISDGVAPTYVLYVGGKEVASMQPNSNSVPKDLRDSPAYRKRLSNMKAKDAIQTFNSESFGDDSNQEYTTVTKRDYFMRDWLLNQPDENLIIRPYVWSKTPGFKLGHSLWDEAWAYRKKRQADGTIVVEKVKQIPSYTDDEGRFSVTPRWRDYTEVYAPENYQVTVPKRYASDRRQTGQMKEMFGGLIKYGSDTSYEVQETVTSLGAHLPIELGRKTLDRYRSDPSVATGEKLVTKSEDVDFVTSDPNMQVDFAWSNMQLKQEGLPFGKMELGKKNQIIPSFLLSADQTTTVVEKSDPREMTTYTTTYTKYQDPITKTFKVVQFTTLSSPLGVKNFDPVLVFETDDSSKVNLGNSSSPISETEVEDRATQQIANWFNMETEMQALSLAQKSRQDPRVAMSPVNIKFSDVGTKKPVGNFDLWKSLWRDFPPFFVDEKAEETKPSFVAVTEDNRQLVPNPKMFNFWKALWRDYPPLFLPEPDEQVTVPNPRFFNLWKSLWRDYPPLFVER